MHLFAPVSAEAEAFALEFQVPGTALEGLEAFIVAGDLLFEAFGVEAQVSERFQDPAGKAVEGTF